MVRSIAYEFKTDTVFVVASQAICIDAGRTGDRKGISRNRCVPQEREALRRNGSQTNARWRKAGRVGTLEGLFVSISTEAGPQLR